MKSKMPSVFNNDGLTSDFYSAPLTEFGVRARVKRCRSSRLLMALAITTPGMKVHKSGCFRQTQTLQAHLTSVSLVDGVLTLLNVVSRLHNHRTASRGFRRCM